MPYKIVKTFEKGKSKLSAVPSIWESDGVLHWPKYNENKLKRIENSHPEHNWRKMNCKVKRSNILTFQEAEQEIDKMCKRSDTETETEYLFNCVRSQNDMMLEKIVQDCIESDNISLGGLAETDKATDRQKVLYQPDENNLQNSLIIIQPPSINTDSDAQQDVTTEVQIDNSSLSLMVLEKIGTLEEQYKTLNEKITESIKIQLDERKNISESVQSILVALSNITVQFEHIMNQFSRSEKTKLKTNIQNITNENDLSSFEKSLDNPEVEEEWKKKLSVICGKGKGRGVNNAYALVDSMFSRGFLLQCSWSGGSRTSAQKICFKSHTKIINFFFDIIHELDSSYTLIDCHNFFKNILKNSRQRNESKQQRISRTKNRPKIKALRQNLSNEEQPSSPITGTSAPEKRSDISLPVVGTSGSSNDDPMSSTSVVTLASEPFAETSV